MAILIVILVMVSIIVDQTTKVWVDSTAKIESFQSARAAYATMTMRLRQATLNTYLDYYDANGNVRPPYSSSSSTFVPATYARTSDLHFIVNQANILVPGSADTHPTHAIFFLAPLGFTVMKSTYNQLPNLLNACGYYIEFNSDKNFYPSFIDATTVKERYRYRLMEFLQPTESLGIYSNLSPSTGCPAPYDSWFFNFLPTNIDNISTSSTSVPLRMISENIIALVILPELSPYDQSGSVLAPTYAYDSKSGTITTITHNQLPPLLRVVMVAIDEPSARHLNPNGSTTPPTVISNLLTGGSALFQTSSNLNADIATLTSALIAQKVNYRVFDTEIAIRGAQWSNQ